MKVFRGFAVAISFLTRIPINHGHQPAIGLAAPWFPFVGALIGAIVGSTAWGVSNLTNPLVGAAFAVLLGVLITGAFHEDGLADCADAFVGGWSIEQRLKILKDPLHGSYGVAAMCGSILFRIVALGSLAPRQMFVAAIATHCLARAGALGLMITTSLARHEGLGSDYVKSLNRYSALFSLLVSLIFVVALLGPWSLVAITAAVLGCSLIRWWSNKKIGGLTGDVLGAAEQVSAAFIFLALSAR